MKYKDKTKQQFSKISMDPLNKNGEGAQFTHNLEILSKTAMGFVELSIEKDIYEFIGKCLFDIAGDVYVIVNSINKETRKVQMRALLVGKYIEAVSRIMKRNPVGMSFVINDEALEGLSKGKLVKVPGGIYELSFKKLPKVICNALEKFLGIGDIYAMGFVKKGELYGNAVILMRKGAELRNKEVIEVFMNQAGVALQRSQVEEELRKSEEKYRYLFELSPDGIITVDTKGMVTSCNTAFTEIIGFSKDEIVGKHVFKMPTLLVQNIPMYAKLLSSMLKGKLTSVIESNYKRKDGATYTAEAHPGLIRKDGKIVGIQTVLKDITERKKMEKEKEKLYKQLIQSEKMAGIGTLAAGVAHEFNNLMTIIAGQAELGKTEELPKDAAECFDVILNTMGRGAKIVEKLAVFSKTGKTVKENCDIRDIINRTLLLVENQLNKQNIEIIKKYSNIPKTCINESEMQQVFLNMLINARDSIMPKSGKITIETNVVNKRIETRISDTGKGIKEENLAKVFEPFYTTKGAFGKDVNIKGTGLGLSVSYGIINTHGGTIEVESKVGKGTTFKIMLPIKKLTRLKELINIRTKKKEKPFKPKNILIVDDEKVICEMLTRILLIKGHKVKYALSGQEAIKLLRKEEFNIIFLDIIMPGSEDFKLLKKVKTILPKAKVMMMTGKFVDDILLDELRQKGAEGCIQKPFNMKDILEAVNESGSRSS